MRSLVVAIAAIQLGLMHPVCAQGAPGSAGQIDTCPTLSQDLGNIDHPEGQGSKQWPSPFSFAAPFDSGAKI